MDSTRPSGIQLSRDNSLPIGFHSYLTHIKSLNLVPGSQRFMLVCGIRRSFATRALDALDRRAPHHDRRETGHPGRAPGLFGCPARGDAAILRRDGDAGSKGRRHGDAAWCGGPATAMPVLEFTRAPQLLIEQHGRGLSEELPADCMPRYVLTLFASSVRGCATAALHSREKQGVVIEQTPCSRRRGALSLSLPHTLLMHRWGLFTGWSSDLAVATTDQQRRDVSVAERSWLVGH